MPLQFVIGRAGTGKTAGFLDQICAMTRAEPLGRPIWLIVPKQATFEYERALVSRIGAFARVRVVGFESLGEAILESCGGIAIPLVSSAGRRMMIGRLLYRNHEQLKFFGSSARRPGLAAAVDQLFDDFERSGQSLDELGDLVDQLSHVAANPLDPAASSSAIRAPTLAAKLADLRLLYTQYRSFLGSDRLDPERRRRDILERASDCELIRHSDVFVDAFYEFTHNERLVLAEVATIARSVYVSLTLPADSPVLKSGNLPAEDSVFHRTERTYLLLSRSMTEAGVGILKPQLLTAPRRFRSVELASLESSLFARHPRVVENQSSGAPSVTFIEAADARSEVQAVARTIADLLRTDHLRQRDVLVLARQMDDYLHLIHAAFKEHDLTYFADRRRPASHHPLIRMVRGCVRVARERSSPGALVALVKTGLAGLTGRECHKLENHLLETAADLQPCLSEPAAEPLAATAISPGFLEGRGPTEQVEGAELPPASALPGCGPSSAVADRDMPALREHLRHRLSPALDALRRGGRAQTVKDFATALLQTLERFDVRQILVSWIDNVADAELADEHQVVWNQLQQLFEELVATLGAEQVTPAEFIETLEAGLDEFDLALRPAKLDQVIVGSIDRTRSLSPRVVFVLGLSRGIFPVAHRDDSLLSGPERRELHRHAVDIDPSSERRQLDERFLAYQAMTRSSSRLFLSRPCAAEGGRELEASEFWDAARGILPNVPLLRAEQQAADRISTPRGLIAELLLWARSRIDLPATRPDSASSPESVVSPEPATPDPLPQLYEWLARRPRGQLPLDRLVGLAWPSLRYRNRATLSERAAKTLWPAPLALTPDQLESMAACPFQHFARYGLGLAERATPGFGAREHSTLFHRILQAVVQRCQQEKIAVASITPGQAAEWIATELAVAALDVVGNAANDDPRIRYQLGRIRRTAAMVIATLQEQLSRGDWSPDRVGVRYGPDGRHPCPPIQTLAGASFTLSGRIDRIDRTAKNELAIFDYRLNDAAVRLAAVYHGLQLRLLTALWAVARGDRQTEDKPLRSVAALSSRLQRSLQDLKHPGDAADPNSPAFRLAHRLRGVVHVGAFSTFDRSAEESAPPLLGGRLKQDGGIADPERSDLYEQEEFDLLIDFVEQKLATLAAEIAGGGIAVAPYKLGDETPCPRCAYRSVCRFERPINSYRFREPMGRSVAIEAMRVALKQRPLGVLAKTSASPQKERAS